MLEYVYVMPGSPTQAVNRGTATSRPYIQIVSSRQRVVESISAKSRSASTASKNDGWYTTSPPSRSSRREPEPPTGSNIDSWRAMQRWYRDLGGRPAHQP